MEEVQEAVFAGAGFAVLGFLMGGAFMIYPPFYENVGSIVFIYLKIGLLLTILGGIFFWKVHRLGILFLLWENLILMISWSYLALLISEAINSYGISSIVMYFIMLNLACVAILQLFIRAQVGGYKASVKAGRFKDKTFSFFPKCKVEFFLPIQKDNRIQRSINRFLSILTAASGGIGAIVEGTGLLAPVFVMALSVSCLIITYIWFKVMLPDLLFCLHAGFKKGA
jgi:hypothetical protein